VKVCRYSGPFRARNISGALRGFKLDVAFCATASYNVTGVFAGESSVHFRRLRSLKIDTRLYISRVT
jgi:hypothetical protein